jgi:hypothetical protein
VSPTRKSRQPERLSRLANSPIASVTGDSSAASISASTAARTKSSSRASNPLMSRTSALPSLLIMVCTLTGSVTSDITSIP